MFLIILLVVVFALFAWWHIAENRQIEKDYKDKLDWQTERWLIRFAWSRTIQLLAAIACAIIIAMIGLSGPSNQASSPIPALMGSLSALTSTSAPTVAAIQPGATPPAAAPSAPAPVVQPTSVVAPQATVVAVAPTPVPASTIATQNALENSLVTASTQPAPAPAAAPAPAPVQPKVQVVASAAAPSGAQAVDDLYNPEKKAGDAQSSMDGIKKRYEDILVIYMFLKKCGKAKDGDYSVILAALGQEMASVNAPGRLQYDILTSAQGSYKELYSKSACSGTGIDALVGQYNDYIKVLSHNITPRQ